LGAFFGLAPLLHAMLVLIEPMRNNLVSEPLFHKNGALIIFDQLHHFVDVVNQSELYTLTCLQVYHNEKVQQLVHLVSFESLRVNFL
jgi:hypothetical protein